jgi:hypothetical protein
MCVALFDGGQDARDVGHRRYPEKEGRLAGVYLLAPWLARIAD